MVNILSSGSVYNEDWCRSAIASYFHEDTKVLVIPFSFKDEITNSEEFQTLYMPQVGKYYAYVVNPLLALGVKEENIFFVDYFAGKVEDTKRRIRQSDVVYFTGGLPDRMVERIKDYGILPELQAFNGVVMGFSAGAMVQLGDYHITPDEDYAQYLECKGLGYIKDWDIEVHFTNNDEQKASIQKVTGEQGRKIYAIAEDGLVLVEDGQVSCFGKVEVKLGK